MATSSTPKQNLSPAASNGKDGSKNSSICVNLMETFNDIQNMYNKRLSNKNYNESDTSSQKMNNNINSIFEIQQLRSQFRNIVMNGKTDSSPDDQSFSSISSVDTVTLLRNSPDLELDEHGILMSSISNSGYIQQKLREDTSLLRENNILKENIEKERSRRKYCESQIEELQNKILECQEQLAVAVSAEKKKELMIEQFDKTLGNIVEGWKQQETLKNNELMKLQRERDLLQAAQVKQDQVLKQFESDLSEAVDAFAKEQERFKLEKEENESMMKTLENEKNNLNSRYENCEKEVFNLKNENMQLLKDKEKILIDQEKRYANFQKEIEEGKICKKNLESSLTQLDMEYRKCQEQLKNVSESSTLEIKQLRDINEDLLQEKKLLLAEQNSMIKEKETLSMELSLSRSKFDALKTQQDSELRAKLEEEFNEQIYKIQRQISDTENELRLSQQQQLNELAATHRSEMEKIKQNFMKEMQAKDTLIFSLHQEQQNETKEIKEENINLKRTCKQLQSQRGELVTKLRYLMEQQWKDTLNIFSMEQTIPGKVATTNQLSSTLQHADHSFGYNNATPKPTSYDVSSISSQQTSNNNGRHQFENIGLNNPREQKKEAEIINYRPIKDGFKSHRNQQENISAENQMLYSHHQRLDNGDQNLATRILKRLNNNFEHTHENNELKNFDTPTAEAHQLIPEKPFNDSEWLNDNYSNTGLNNHAIKNMENHATDEPFTLVYEDLNHPQSFIKDNQVNLIPRHTDVQVENKHSVSDGYHSNNSKQEQKQQQLSHFIEKLLQKSPGQVTENTDEDTSTFQTPKQLSNPSQAFKKSVLRERFPLDYIDQSDKRSDNMKKVIGHKINNLNEDQLQHLMKSLNSTQEEKPLRKNDNTLQQPADVFDRLHKNMKKPPPPKAKSRSFISKESKRVVKSNSQSVKTGKVKK